jgi:hypothetical protein
MNKKGIFDEGDKKLIIRIGGIGLFNKSGKEGSGAWQKENGFLWLR